MRIYDTHFPALCLKQKEHSQHDFLLFYPRPAILCLPNHSQVDKKIKQWMQLCFKNIKQKLILIKELNHTPDINQTHWKYASQIHHIWQNDKTSQNLICTNRMCKTYILNPKYNFKFQFLSHSVRKETGAVAYNGGPLGRQLEVGYVVFLLPLCYGSGTLSDNHTAIVVALPLWWRGTDQHPYLFVCNLDTGFSRP